MQIKNVRKRLYLGLLSAAFVLIAGVLVYAWLTIFQRDSGILRYFFAACVVAFFIWLVFIGIGFAGIVISLVSERAIRLLDRPMNFTFSILYPVVIWLGKIFKITQDKIQRSFVEVNNQLVKTRKKKVPASKILVLLPHCLQDNSCRNRITTNTDNCVRCGKCPVGDLLNLCDRYGVHLRVATGGTLAREAVKTIRPAAIVAVACERDLTSGILDCIPLPVLGVTNERPMGPCHNTTVRLDAVENAICYFLRGEENVFSPV